MGCRESESRLFQWKHCRYQSVEIGIHADIRNARMKSSLKLCVLSSKFYDQGRIKSNMHHYTIQAPKIDKTQHCSVPTYSLFGETHSLLAINAIGTYHGSAMRFR